jgi:hypothetical protein
LIATAKAAAYGPNAKTLGDMAVEIDVRKISEDPLITYMRRLVRERGKKRTQATSV